MSSVLDIRDYSVITLLLVDRERGRELGKFSDSRIPIEGSPILDEKMLFLFGIRLHPLAVELLSI